ncbi:MAG: alpha/beta fold hydrolase [Chloroflexi bacterium]|nr:alpha/beta fold hydrolase [Chloroflexota bacterium]
MPYADNNGVRIYYEVEGDGPPLVLQHGFGDSGEGWRATGYVDALKDDYQLILVDARGHGKSDKPHDAADYEMRHRVSDIVAALDDLGIERARFLGYSMGGRIGFGIGKYAPERFSALMIGGMHPYKADRKQLERRARQLRDIGVESLVPAWEEASRYLTPGWRERVLANDARALIASTLEWRDWHGLADSVRAMAMPCLVYIGERDGLRSGAEECVKHIPNAKLVVLPGLDHMQAYVRSDLVLPHVKQFLNENA